MSSAPEPAVVLATLTDTIERMQKSARRTIPMFAVGILATVVAAAVAVYYILTLSANLHEANRKLLQSQNTVAEMQTKLASLSTSLQQAQKTVTSPVAAQTIANAISDVSSSQQTLATVSSSINAAAANIVPVVTPQAPIGRCMLQAGTVTYLEGSCEIELYKGGSFKVWAVGRTGASGSVVRQGAYGIGSWQSAPGQPWANLGTLQRQDACWFNDNGKICAWK